MSNTTTVGAPCLDVSDVVIPSVRALSAYTLKATRATIKLNQNESPFDMPSGFKEKILARVAAQSWNRYPDFYPEDVLKGIGALHGLGAQNVLLGNGSNELIQAVMSACVARGARVAYPEPTFTLYAMMIAANEGTPVPVPLMDDLGYDFAAWETLADQGDTHLLLCSPNNPTGSVVDAAWVAALAARTSKLVIVDEAYAHFGPHDLSRLVKAHPNVLVLRTFSKALGLAAVRLGYALATPQLAAEINKVKLPYNVGIFGLEVARALLEEAAASDDLTALTNAERARVAATLAEIPSLEVFDGFANFVLFRCPDPARLFDALLDEGILVRNVSHYPRLAGCLRVSIGLPEHNDAFLHAVARFYDTRFHVD